MARVYVANPDQCTGCRTCELYCSMKKTGGFAPRAAGIWVVKDEETGVDRPVICRQCDNALCVAACGTGALRRAGEKVVVDEDLCSGCGACVRSCPFSAIRIDPRRSKAVKCDLCGGRPECVAHCATAAIEYGH